MSIVVKRASRYAILDELEYYREIYKESEYVPVAEFYNILYPFRMDSQVQASAADILTDSHRSKRKAKRSIRKLADSDFIGLCDYLRQCLTTAVEENRDFFANISSLDTKNDNNKCVRDLVQRVEGRISNQSWKAHDKKQSSLGTVVFRDRYNRVLLEQDRAELNIYNNAVDVPVTIVIENEKFIIPSHSSFICGDVSLVRHLSMRGMKFDLIVLDPPWANRSVKRKNPYVVAGGERDLFGLEIAQLLSGNGLVAMWATNRTLILENIETIFDEWGVQKVATWCWLKVTKTGDPVCSFKFHHKVPFERIVFACRPEDVHIHSKSLADNFLLISTPCGIHSRKPPLLPILQSLSVIGNSSCLELFSRNLLPNTVSIGYEVTKFQNVAWFDKR